jgi:ATP-dependent Clp protease ATP-binding subunit ClpX
VGRFPTWVALQELKLEDLIRILTDIKHCYIDQYRWLFKQDNIDLSFEKDAIETIAQNTLKNKTGARGLHSELERVLLPHMFNVGTYCSNGMSRVLIDLELVNTPRELEVPHEQAIRQVSNS